MLAGEHQQASRQAETRQGPLRVLHSPEAAGQPSEWREAEGEAVTPTLTLSLAVATAPERHGGRSPVRQLWNSSALSMRKVFSQVPHRNLYSPSTWRRAAVSGGGRVPGGHCGGARVCVVYVFLYRSPAWLGDSDIHSSRPGAQEGPHTRQHQCPRRPPATLSAPGLPPWPPGSLLSPRPARRDCSARAAHLVPAVLVGDVLLQTLLAAEQLRTLLTLEQLVT